MAATKKPKTAYHHGDLRDALLKAAVSLIAEEGLAHLSLRECARRAGVSHAAPYRHFESKDELLRAIAEDGYARLAEAGRRAMEGKHDANARIDAYGVAYVRFAVENPVHHRVMFTAQLVPEDERSKSVLGADAFNLLVDSAAAASRSGTDPMLNAMARWALPHGLSMLILDGRVPTEIVSSPDDAERLAKEVFAIWRTARTEAK